MSKEDDALATMLAHERDALKRLTGATAYAANVVRGKPGDVEKATTLLGSAVSSVVVTVRGEVRAAAAKQFSQDTGLDVTTSGTDDTMRGEKAGAYYAKAWLAAFTGGTKAAAGGGSSGGGGSSDDWDASVDAALAAASGALGRVASFEVAHAWNDEHKRNVAALPSESFTHQWFTKLDTHVCKQCAKYHGTFADSNDEFPEGWPPLHGDCRCIVYTRLVDASKAQAAPKGTSMDPYLAPAPPKHAGAEMAHCALACEVKKLDIAERTVDVVMSTPTIDRHGERVELDWELRSFKANPIVLWAHDSRDLPLGRCENVRIEANALIGTIRFCSAAANPKAEQCLQLFREGVLNAVSVGFIPHSYRFEKDDDEEILVLSQNELVELSVTPTPANPEALVRRRAKALAMRTAEKSNVQAAPGDGNGTEGAPPQEKDIMSTTDNDKGIHGSIEKQATTIAEQTVSIKTLTDRAEKAEKALADATAKGAEADTKLSAFEAQTKKLADERDAATKRVSELEAKLFEQEVDGLVGKKISAAEKPTFLKLLKQDRTLFDEMIAQRAPMKLDESVTEPGAAKNGSPAAVGDTSDLATEFKDAAGL